MLFSRKGCLVAGIQEKAVGRGNATSYPTTKSIHHRGVVWLGGNQTPQNTETYLTFVLSVRVTHLWVAPYTEYQQLLFVTITGFREKGWNYPNRTMVEPERLQNSSGCDISRFPRTFHRQEEQRPEKCDCPDCIHQNGLILR